MTIMLADSITNLIAPIFCFRQVDLDEFLVFIKEASYATPHDGIGGSDAAVQRVMEMLRDDLRKYARKTRRAKDPRTGRRVVRYTYDFMKAFNLFDEAGRGNADGEITLGEFRDGLERLELAKKLSRAQVKTPVRRFDPESPGLPPPDRR